MSSVKTELYFRQVLGRILRVNSGINQQAWLYTFAEQNLIEFSERIEQDIPDSCMFAKIERLIEFESESQRTCLTGHGLLEEREEVNSKLVWSSAISTELNSAGSLSALGDLQLGAFKQRVISAFLATS